MIAITAERPSNDSSVIRGVALMEVVCVVCPISRNLFYFPHLFPRRGFLERAEA